MTTVHLFECTFYYVELELIFFQHRIGKCPPGVTVGFSESDTDRLTGKMTGKVCKTGKTINQVKQNKLTILGCFLGQFLKINRIKILSKSDTIRLTGKMTGKVRKTGKMFMKVKRNKLTIFRWF